MKSKRILSFLLSAAMCLALLPSFASAASANVSLQGNGQASDPYLISTAADLKQFADMVNEGTDFDGNYLKLEQDIDLGGATNSWTPIGKELSKDKNTHTITVSKFKGVFDGNGKTISGLYINGADRFQGLFGAVYGGTIKNLTVKGTMQTTGSYVGGIVGYLKDGTVENCINECTISGSSNSVGGIVGFAGTDKDGENTTSVVKLCQNKAAVAGYASVGGIVGNTSVLNGTADASKEITIENCCNTGTVSATTQTAGGILGQPSKNGTTKLQYCYNTANVSAPTFVGGIIGASTDSMNVTKCYYLANCVAATATEGTVIDAGTKKEQTAFASGEVAYLLQDGQTEQVWGQTIGIDTLPNFTGLKVSQKENSYYNADFKILGIGEDNKSASLALGSTGTYQLVFAAYEDGKLANVKIVEVTAASSGVQIVSSGANFTLKTGDKVMLWNNLNDLKPLCETYEVK